VPVTKYGPFVLQFRNFDRQKTFFIRYSRKFHETSSDQAGTKPFYGGNFYEIFDDGTPLTIFKVLYERMLQSCILMVMSTSLKEVAEKDR